MTGKKLNKNQKKTEKLMTVYWDDATLIVHGQVMIKLPLKMTTGEYLGEEKGFIVLKKQYYGKWYHQIKYIPAEQCSVPNVLIPG